MKVKLLRRESSEPAFEVNENARRFYEKNGFKIKSKGHENEENLPDILYEWISNK